MPHSQDEDQHASPLFTWRGFFVGARQSLSVLPGLTVFAGVIGALSADKGMSVAEVALMSGFVYAGASQLTALHIWQPQWTASGVLAVWLVTIMINLRMLLMSAALYPTLSRLRPWQAYLSLTLLTDANFMIGARHQDSGSRDVGPFVGAGVFLWLCWVATTVPGHILGDMLADPKRFGIDMILPIIFAVNAVAVARLPRDRVIWPITASIALAAAWMFDNYSFIVIGALGGALAAGALRERF